MTVQPSSTGSAGALEQIAIVCTDNMAADCNHRMALDFVRQIANDHLHRPQDGATALIARADKYLNTGSGEYASDIMRDMVEFIRRLPRPPSAAQAPLDRDKIALIIQNECAERLYGDAEILGIGPMSYAVADRIGGVAYTAWQPIETAPKDGRIILLGNMGSAPRPAYWGLADKTFGAGADKKFPWTFLDNTNGVNQMSCDWTGPSHWMPLPAPPPQASSVTSTPRATPPDWKQDQAETSRLAPKLPSTDGKSP